MSETMRETAFALALEELARSRGLSGLEELVARVNAAGHNLRHVEGELTVERLLEGPPTDTATPWSRSCGCARKSRTVS